MRKGTEQDYRERISKVQRYIQEYLDEPISLEQLAKVACFSPFHFHRLFGAMVGESVKEYARRLRLERSANLVRYSKRSFLEIGIEAGYESHAAFSRAFKKRFGCSPQVYRDSKEVPPLENFVLTHKEGRKVMDVTVKKMDAMKVAAVRHIGPYKECKGTWEMLCSSLPPSYLSNPNTLYIGISYDDPDVTEASQLRYDACVTVDEALSLKEPLTTQVVEGGIYAVYVHKGSYDGLHDAYRGLYGQWLPQSGYEPKAAPTFEIYRNSPDTTPTEELITEICIPLQG